jgi:hypothetical protein
MSALIRKGVSHASATTAAAQFKPKLSLAYEEGRRQFPSGTNPFAANSPQNIAWQLGYDNRADAAYKRDTAVA